jgi:hypothetical protein
MLANKYEDRFNESTYDNSAPCIIALFDKEVKEDNSMEIFEGLVIRLKNIGIAYDLHILPLFDIYGDVFLNQLQCENLLSELEFVERLTNDPLLHNHIVKIKKLATQCLHADGQLRLLISGN